MTAPSYLCRGDSRRERYTAALAAFHHVGVRFLTAARGYVQLDAAAYAVLPELELGRVLGMVDAEAIEAMEAEAQKPRPPFKRPHNLAVGQDVRVLAGPWRGLTGRIVRLTPAWAIVLLPAFRGVRPIRMPLAHIVEPEA